MPAEPEGSHAAHFLRLLHGRPPAPEVARVLDTILTLHADHELNASTFAVRVAVATLADLHAALVAAIATLKGPRHGGANEDVLAMLLEIGDPGRAEAYVAARLDAHARGTRAERADPRTRIPGFGHRVYRVDDARARVLRQMAKTMAEATGHARLFEVAEGVYAAMTARTSLPVNVDFFSAVVYHALGHPGRPLHVDLRGRAGGRLVRARPRAVRGQPPDPAAGGLHGVAAARAGRRRALNGVRRGAVAAPGALPVAPAGGLLREEGAHALAGVLGPEHRLGQRRASGGWRRPRSCPGRGPPLP